MSRNESMSFNGYKITGWDCSCGEKIFDGGAANRILLLNKLKTKAAKAKLGRIRTNLILRVPKAYEEVLHLKEGEEVELKIDGKGFKVVPL